jgi:hypothetical protein
VRTKKLDAVAGEGKATAEASPVEADSSETPTVRTDDAGKGEAAVGQASSEAPTIREELPAGAQASERSSSEKAAVPQPATAPAGDDAAPTDERPTVRTGVADGDFPAGATVVPADGPMRVPHTLVSGGDEALPGDKPAVVAVVDARVSATPAPCDAATAADRAPRPSLVKPLAAMVGIAVVLAGLWLLTRNSGATGDESASPTGPSARGEVPSAAPSPSPSSESERAAGENRDAGASPPEGSTASKHLSDGGAPSSPSPPAGWPTGLPSVLPTALPTLLPTAFPTALPTTWPTAFPTTPPTSTKTSTPTPTASPKP